MNTLKKTLSVIIVNYKSEKYLHDCVDSVRKKINNDILADIVIVDNDQESNLGTIESIPSIRIIRSSQNKGFGSASNLGARNSQGDFLFFLNPDARVSSGNIGGILDDFHADPSLGIVGGKLLNKDGMVQEWSAGDEINFSRIVSNNLGFIKDKEIWMSGSKIPVGWVSGTAFIMRKNLFESLGGFDEDFFMYFEDADLCKRARDFGKTVRFDPGLEIIHHGGASYENEAGSAQKRHYYGSQDRYFKKHRHPVESGLLKAFRKTHLFFSTRP
ncbi:MAG: glycosyltransferase [Candidatus Moranbacteria bacterium]|nr:glycosyltransferase [Candidatus Moranbacteria bacterium]